MTSIRGVAVVVLCALVVTGGFAGGFVTVGLFTATESVSGTFSTDESFAVTVVGGDRSSDDGPTDEPGDDEAEQHSNGGVENGSSTAANGDGKNGARDDRNVTLEDEPPTEDGVVATAPPDETDGAEPTDDEYNETTDDDGTDDASLESSNGDSDGGADAEDPDAEDASSG